MKFDFNNIAPYIGFFASLFSLGEIAINKAKRGVKCFKDNPTDVANFYDSLENGEFNLGETISVNGLFLNYGQINKPYTYINSVWRPSDIQSMKDHNTIHKGTEHELKNGEILFERNPIIVPAQRIPDSNNISYGFLYDERFTGFIRNNMPEQIKNSGEMLVKDRFCNPILVVYDKSMYPDIIDGFISLKRAKIIRGPEIVSDYVKSLLNANEGIGISNIYRPLKFGNDIICISLLESDTKVIKVKPASDLLGHDFKIPLFTEGTYNLLYDKPFITVAKIISELAPASMKYIGQLPSFRDEMDNAVSFLSMNNTNIIYREPGTIGFYSEMSYFDDEKFNKEFMDYNTLIKNFTIDFKSFSNRNFGVKEKFNMTFIFDYAYKNLFKSSHINTDFRYVRESDKILDMYKNDIDRLF